MSNKTGDVIELEDRDPNALSHHLQVGWDEIFGEPKSIHSPEFSWGVSRKCFRFARNGCYTCLAVLCAPISALCLGITFACLSFEQIWCVNPCLRIWTITCDSAKKFIGSIANCFIIPIAEACGYLFSQIHIKHSNQHDSIINNAEKKTDAIA